jgi:hypothetical protein
LIFEKGPNHDMFDPFMLYGPFHEVPVLSLGHDEKRHRWLKCPMLLKEHEVTYLRELGSAEDDLIPGSAQTMDCVAVRGT